MKHMTIALVFGALPALAFGQTSVSCDACTHDVPVYTGNGGFIAEVDGADMVAWTAACGGVTHHGELAPDEQGLVMVQFMDNGLVCNEDESRLQIGPVKDGGWYWLTDVTDSATGPLVNQDVLGNAKTDLTDPGPGVTIREGRGAVLLKEISTGRLGVLPNILPEPPMAGLRKCGYDKSGTTYTRRNSECALGDGGTMILATSTNAFTGQMAKIANGGAFTRPGGSGTAEIVIDLWMNGSGHYTTAAAASGDGDVGTVDSNPKRGHPEFGMTATRAADHLTGVRYATTIGGSGPAGSILTDDGTAQGGVSFTVENDTATFSIAADETYCSSTANHSLPVSVNLTMDPTQADQVTPAVKLDSQETPTSSPKMEFTVVCP